MEVPDARSHWNRGDGASKARRLYDAVTKTLGLGIVTPHKDFFLLGRGPGQIPYLWIGILARRTRVEGSRAASDECACVPAKDNAMVDEFYRAALAAGGHDDGKPGPRPASCPRSSWTRTATTSRRWRAVE